MKKIIKEDKMIKIQNVEKRYSVIARAIARSNIETPPLTPPKEGKKLGGVFSSLTLPLSFGEGLGVRHILAINFHTYANKFSYLWKKIFSLMKIYFLPYENLLTHCENLITHIKINYTKYCIGSVYTFSEDKFGYALRTQLTYINQQQITKYTNNQINTKHYVILSF